MVSWNGLFWWKSFYVKYHLKMTINVTKPEFLIERFKFDCIYERAQRIFLSIQISLYLQPTDGVIKRDYLEYSFQKCLKRKEICFIVNWFWWRDFRFSQSEECFRISQEKDSRNTFKTCNFRWLIQNVEGKSTNCNKLYKWWKIENCKRQIAFSVISCLKF